MLTDVRDLLRRCPSATLGEIATHLGVAPEVARGLCDLWIAKGRVERIVPEVACGGCARCPAARQESYRWIGEGGAARPC